MIIHYSLPTFKDGLWMALCQQLDGESNEVLLQFLVLKSSLIGESFVVCRFKAALRRPEKLLITVWKITTAAVANYGSETYFIYIHHRPLLRRLPFNSSSYLTLNTKQWKPQISVSVSSFTSKNTPPTSQPSTLHPPYPIPIWKHPHWVEDEKIVLRNSKGNLTFFGCFWNFQYSAVIASYTLYIFIWGNGGDEEHVGLFLPE